VENPVLVSASSSALRLLGLGAEEGERDDAALYFSGEFLAWGLGHPAETICSVECALGSSPLAALRCSALGALLLHESAT